MKKFLFQILFLISVLPGMAQGSIYIQGTVTDSLTGSPVANHTVTIRSDSASGFSYYHVALTNPNGFYIDTVSLNGTVVNSLLVSTLDCNQLPQTQVITVQQGVTTYQCNFSICTNTVPCTANFGHYQTQFFEVYFYDTSPGTGHSCFWSFGDGTSSTQQNPLHTFAAAGYYTVSLTISDSLTACLDTKTETVYVNGNTPYYLKMSGNVTNFITGNPMPNHPVTWGFGDTLSGPRTVYTNVSGYYADSVLLPATSSGDSYVWSQDCHTIAWMGGSYSISHHYLTQDFFVNCELNPSCVAKFKFNAAGPLTIQFEDISKGGATSRLWNFGDGTTSTEINPLHTYATQGDFSVSLIINNGITLCADSEFRMVHLSDSILCLAGYTYNYTSDPHTIDFQDITSSSNNERHWYFGDGKSSDIPNPSHTFNFPGLYLVDLEAGNYTLDCHSTAIKSILISDSILPCQSYFTYTINPAYDKKTVQFTDQSAGTPDTWFWDFGDGDTSVLRYPIHSYTAPGIYHVCLTINGFQCTSTFCSDVTITDTTIFHQVYGQVFAGNFPITSGEAMIFSTDTTGSGQPFTDTAPIDSLGVYYFTLVPEGNYYLVATPANAPGYLPTYFGNTLTWQQSAEIQLGTANNPYTINLLPSGLMNSGPGSASGQINVTGFKTTIVDKVNMILLNAEGIPIGFTTVSASGAFSFPTLAYGVYYLHAEMPGITSDYVPIELTPEKPDATVVMTFTGSRIIGIKEESPMVTQWIVYPNPFADELTVEVDMLQAAEASVNIFNFSGQLQLTMVADFKAGQNIITIPAMDLQPGIYILRIFSPEGLNLHRKLIKR